MQLTSFHLHPLMLLISFHLHPLMPHISSRQAIPWSYADGFLLNQPKRTPGMLSSFIPLPCHCNYLTIALQVLAQVPYTNAHTNLLTLMQRKYSNCITSLLYPHLLFLVVHCRSSDVRKFQQNPDHRLIYAVPMTTNLALTHMLGATKEADKEHRNREAGGKEGGRGDKEKGEAGEEDKGKDEDGRDSDQTNGGVFCEACQVGRRCSP